MKKAVILVWNNFTNDKRVMNVANAFAKKFNCTVLAAKTINELLTKESMQYNIYRIPLISSLKKSSNNVSSKDKQSSNTNRSFYNSIVKNNRIKLILFEFLNVITYEFMVFKFIIKDKPDIVYCNDLDTLAVGYLSAKLVKAKIIYDSHEIFLDGSRYHNATFLRKMSWKLSENIYINRVDSVIVTTNYRKKLIEEYYKIKNVKVIRNCHPRTTYKKKNKFRQEFNIPEETPILLYQGGLTEVRGIFTIVDIVVQIKDISMVFMGMGKDKQKLITYIKTKKCEKRIFVKDAVSPDKLIDYTSSADIGLQLLQNINANHYSTISNKIFEYMTAGLAIIASDFPEIKKIVIGYKLGYVVDPSSKKDIQLAIMEIINDKITLNRMKMNSRNASIENIWEREEEKLKKILNKVFL